MLGFDLADKYRNPVMILGDAFLGQMAEVVSLRERRRGRVYKKEWALTGAKNRAPCVIRSLFLKEGVLEEHNKALQRKYALIEKKEKRWEEISVNNAEIIFVAYGISFRIAYEAAKILEKKGVKIGVFRPITLWPYPSTPLRKVSEGKKAVFVFELSSGQMVEDVRLAVGERVPVYFYGRMGGGVFNEEELVKFVKKKLR